MKQLADQRILIMGLGLQGLAMARWCARWGAQVAVWDSRDDLPQRETLRAEWPQIEWRQGALTAQDAVGLQWLLKGPGLAPHDERIAPVWQAAQAAGIRTGGELDLFSLALNELRGDSAYQPQVLAITGTNGKTTTTALTAQLVQRAGWRAVAAGNIGPTLLDTLSAELDALANVATSDDGTEATPPALPQVWVLELSSFQLADLQVCASAEFGFEPSAAVVLNVTQDHLDWHGDMAAYAQAKARIFGRTATMVINRDDPLVAALEPQPLVGKLPKGALRPEPRRVVRYGLSAPRQPGDFGLVEEAGMAWLVRAMPVDETVKRKKGDEEEELHIQRLMPADALRLRGRHNASNALAALALATSIGCPLAPMLHGLREYRGEKHRVEFVARIGEVEAFDDTKGTNVGATVAALEGLGAERKPAKLLVILGGQGKGQDFSPLLVPVQRHVRAVALIGQDASKLREALEGSGVPMHDHESLEAATAWCFDQAQASDAVLLSPACASLDMFRNYVHRGEVFVSAVQRIAAEHGEVMS